MKNILLLLIGLFLFSCITEKKRAKICQTCPVVIVNHDSIVTVIKDTTIYKTTKETVYKDTIICDSLGRVKDAVFTVNEGGIKHKVIIKNNKIISTCKADSLEIVIKGLIAKQATFQNKTVVVPSKCEKNHLRWFDPYCRWFTLTCILIIVIRHFYLKFKKI